MGGLGLRKLDDMNQACLIKLGCKVFSGDGRDIEAWEDIWIEEGLCIAQHINIPQEIQSARVCDSVDAAGNWNWALLQPWMPRDMQ
ncbi:hypothetical protein A2U01_0054716, partial [Trifolium medium]|nr:hypothetical protein [Trifolium medium]